ncbi:MAG: cytochrome P450 [Planktotalea sp.]|uniref:cytochrome P450 n=1 Tax=Planktotalea sp. TaxID=2029877 RepID=UPI003C70EFC5
MKAISYTSDFYGDAFILDPLPHYAQMRAAGPVVWLEQNNAYAVARDAEVKDVLRRSDVFVSGKGLSLNDDVNAMLVGSTLNSDGDLHHTRRSITARPIMPKNIETLRGRIETISEELAASLSKKVRFDAVTEFAQVLPLAVVVDLVGLGDAGEGNMLKWASATFNLFEGFNDRSKEAFSDLVGLQKFLSEHGKPEHLADGGLAKRIFEVAEEKGLTQSEAAQQMRDYINPSLDTTISAAGFAAYYFAKFPEQWDVLRKDPSLVANAVEEVVRMATPIRAFSRYVAQDTTISGVDLPEGSRVIAVYASANRDDAVWEDPDTFDVRRVVRKHIGFGHGVHTCMGLHLARLELISLIRAMLPRVKRWHIEGQPAIAMNNTIRAFGYLPMRIEAA